MFQLRDSQYFIGKCKQMLSLRLQYVEMFFFLLRFIIYFSTTKHFEANQNGTDRILHVMNHSIREILTHSCQFVLPTNNIHLLTYGK